MLCSKTEINNVFLFDQLFFSCQLLSPPFFNGIPFYLIHSLNHRKSSIILNSRFCLWRTMAESSHSLRNSRLQRSIIREEGEGVICYTLK